MVSRLSDKTFVFRIGFFICWIALFIFLGIQHTAWRDEFQAWLVATQTSSFTEFFTAIRYERQPPLFYCLLKGVSWFFRGDSLWLLRGASWFFSILNIFVILFVLEGPLLFRLLIPLSTLFLFEYGIMARSYSLGIFFILIAAHLNHRRDEIKPSVKFYSTFWICLLLAGGTHLYFTLIGSVAFARSVWISRAEILLSPRIKALTAVIGFGFLVLFLLQTPPSDSHFSSRIHLRDLHLFKGLEFLGFGLTGLNRMDGGYTWNYNFWGHPVFRFFVLGILFQLYRSGFRVGYFLSLVAAPVFIMITAYDPALRHAGLIFVAACFVFFSSKQFKGSKILSLFLLCQILTTAVWLYSWGPFKREPNWDLSGSNELSQKLGNKIKQGYLLGDNLATVHSFAVLGLLDVPMFNVTKDKWVRYPHFSDAEFKFTLEAWCLKYRKEFDRLFPGKKSYLVTEADQSLPEICQPGVLVFESSRNILFDEKYRVYQLMPTH